MALLRVSGRKQLDGHFIDIGRGADYAAAGVVNATAYLHSACHFPSYKVPYLASAIAECERPNSEIKTLLGWLLKFVTTAETLRDTRAKTIYMYLFPGWSEAKDEHKLLIEEWVMQHYRAIRNMNKFAAVSLAKVDAEHQLVYLFQPTAADVQRIDFYFLHTNFNATDPLQCYQTIETFLLNNTLSSLKEKPVNPKQWHDFLARFRDDKRETDVIQIHGYEMLRAYLIQQYLHTQNTAAFFSAQRTEAILFQIALKKLYERRQVPFGKHCKTTRIDELASDDIRLLMDGNEFYQHLCLAASNSIFDTTPGESCFNFLSIEATSGFTRLFYLPELLMANLSSVLLEVFCVNNPARVQHFIQQLTTLWQSTLGTLPTAILELLIINNRMDYAKSIFICDGMARNPRTPSSYQALLSGTDSDNPADYYQVRILAPHPNQTDRVRVLRFTPEAYRPAMTAYKQAVNQLISQLW